MATKKTKAKPERNYTPEARERIAQAQRKRWKKWRKEQKQLKKAA